MFSVRPSQNHPAQIADRNKRRFTVETEITWSVLLLLLLNPKGYIGHVVYLSWEIAQPKCLMSTAQSLSMWSHSPVCGLYAGPLIQWPPCVIASPEISYFYTLILQMGKTHVLIYAGVSSIFRLIFIITNILRVANQQFTKHLKMDDIQSALGHRFQW